MTQLDKFEALLKSILDALKPAPLQQWDLRLSPAMTRDFCEKNKLPTQTSPAPAKVLMFPEGALLEIDLMGPDGLVTKAFHDVQSLWTTEGKIGLKAPSFSTRNVVFQGELEQRADVSRGMDA